jgi:1,4-dihydroxy-2-naphthoate polyprenyltransferase
VTAAPAPAPTMLRHWLTAIRPRTLLVAVVPVLVGTALAWHDVGALSGAILVATVAAAVLIQVATNLHNDVSDFERGADDPGTRLGPRRATAEGWLSPAQVRRGTMVAFSGAGIIGLWLAWQGGWPILAIGVASIACAWGYSGGAKPIAYSSLGELFVWLFFGVAAVAGSYYLQTGRFDLLAVAAGALLGMPAAAVLVVNNYRDRDNDQRAGRRTFAVVFGARASRIEYGVLMRRRRVAAAVVRGAVGGAAGPALRHPAGRAGVQRTPGRHRAVAVRVRRAGVRRDVRGWAAWLRGPPA